MDFDKLYFGQANPRVKEAIENSKNHPIVFFGASLDFSSFDDCLAERNIAFTLADNDSRKWGKKLPGGAAIIAPQEMPYKYKESYVCIDNIADKGHYEEIYEQLMEMGFSSDKILSLTEMFFNIEKSKLAVAYGLMEDDESKEVFRAFHTFDVDERIDNLIKIRNGLFENYFDKNIIQLEENEIFIDAGAYVGDTAQAFIRHTGNLFDAIHSFEPSKDNAKCFLEKFVDYDRITLHQIGLGDEKASVRFSERDSGGGSVNEVGSEIVQIDSLDNILNGERASFIKMDIEGFEFRALKGAEQTIRKFRPKLAICVYHKLVDIIDIAPFLKRCIPEYKLFLRHYGNSQRETVLYAVAE